MRKTINILGWIGVFFTILALILTLLTTYQFTYVKYFDSYYTLQLCMTLTMIMWAIKMFDLKSNLKNVVYPATCFIIAIATIVFMFMKVY